MSLTAWRDAMRWILGAVVVLGPAVIRAQPNDEQQVLAGAAPNDSPARELDARRDMAPSSSQSIGSPDRGRIRNAVEVVPTAHLVLRETRRRPASHGIEELVGLLQRAAARVAVAHPGPRLVVGDLSSERGGRLPPHRSHRSGRDADVSFYLVHDGEPVEPPRFVHLRRNGCGRIGQQRYCFDPVRNWALLVALLTDPIARVQYVLVAPDLRRRLLAEGERQGAPPELLERVRIVTAPNSGSRSHRSHFHVRIYCPLDDRPECVDEPPYHAWYEGEPSPDAAKAVRRRARLRRALARRVFAPGAATAVQQAIQR